MRSCRWMYNDQRTYISSDYAYPCDSYINTLLNSYIVRNSLQKIADKYYADEIADVMTDSYLVDESGYPQLTAIYNTCLHRLGIKEKIPLYVTYQLTGINALSIESRGETMILISRQAVAQLAEEELFFVLGHELGHCQYGHMCCHTILGLLEDMNKANEILGSLLADMIEVPLVKWFHCSEFTADRAGLICCGSKEVAKSIFVRLGLDKEITVFEQYRELSSPHPLLQTRWQMIEQFAIQMNIKS